MEHLDRDPDIIARLDCFNDIEAGMLRSLLPDRALGRVRFTVLIMTDLDSIRVRRAD